MSHQGSIAPIAHRMAVMEGRGSLLRLAPDQVRDQFAHSGALLLRGFDVAIEDFRALTERICSEFVSHPNPEREMIGDRTMTGVTPGNEHFFAHAEMGYSPYRPDVAWFYCIRPAQQGGETTICDGVAVLERLRPQTRALFESKRILFRTSFPREAWMEWAPDEVGLIAKLSKLDPRLFSFTVDATQCLHTRFLASAIVDTKFGKQRACCNSLLDSDSPRFEDDTPIPRDALYDFISSSEEVSVPVAWKAGDVLIVDNSRFMHGRRAFKDPNRKIVVRFGNIHSE